jgi:hypothetical protein
VLTLTGLARYLVLFVIDLQTRRVQIGGVVRQAYGAWMTQAARNLTDGVDRFLIGKRYLLHDRTRCSPASSAACSQRPGGSACASLRAVPT